jgi:hypothetical protein
LTARQESALLISLALLVCLAATAADGPRLPTPIDYMEDLRKAEANAAQTPEGSSFNSALSMLATQQSFVGDTERAIDTFERSRFRPGPEVLSVDEAKRFIADHQVRDALQTILEQTRDRQIVMINEAHHVPRDRAFATLVALELRKRGFKYLAMETLAGDMAAMAARGYSLESNGYYNRDPVYGDFIRRTLEAGYTPIAYEVDVPDDLEGDARADYREEKQAQNLVDLVLAKDPTARILVHVGFGHLWTGPVDAGGGSTRTLMAERLKVKTGIDPFSIDQTHTLPMNENVRAAILAKAPGHSFVLESRTAENPFSESSAAEMYVYHRPTAIVRGRPDWLAMGGYRKPLEIPAKLLPKSGRRLVQAFVAGESADAVPMDQLLVTAGEPQPVFMLPKGKFRFAYRD